MMISRYQRGFTLYEMLVSLAILGVIIPVIGMSIFQVLSINTLTGNHLTAVKQVENALYRINRDAHMAQTVQTGGGSGFPLNLIWVEWDNTSNNGNYGRASTCSSISAKRYSRNTRRFKQLRRTPGSTWGTTGNIGNNNKNEPSAEGILDNSRGFCVRLAHQSICTWPNLPFLPNWACYLYSGFLCSSGNFPVRGIRSNSYRD